MHTLENEGHISVFGCLGTSKGETLTDVNRELLREEVILSVQAAS